MSESHQLWLSLTLSLVVPMLLGISLSLNFPEWRWSHYPVHAMAEGVGAITALTIAALMIIMINNNQLRPRYIVATAALIGMIRSMSRYY